MSRTRLVVLSAAVVAGGACHHAATVTATPAQPAPVARQQSAPTRTDDSAAREAARRAAAARADSISRAEAAAARAEAARRAVTAAVHFDYNRDEIRSEERQRLDQKAAILSANPALAVRIEGNADERGSDEFNLALGMRRAAAVEHYLVQHGVAAGQVSVSSNGEERPLCPGHEESCWGENRRDDVVITAGGDHIVPR